MASSNNSASVTSKNDPNQIDNNEKINQLFEAGQRGTAQLATAAQDIVENNDANTTTAQNSSQQIGEAIVSDEERSFAPQTTEQYQKHIMISYNHASATTITRRIYDRLKERGYHVWFDEKSLHGDILDGMGDAVDNAYVLISFMTDDYARSRYAMAEVKYAFKRNVDIIPCTLERGFDARSSLGLMTSNRMTIEFHEDADFDQAFERLVTEIENVPEESGQRSTENNQSRGSTVTAIPPTEQTSLNERILRIIGEVKSTMDSTNVRWSDLNEEQRRELLRRLEAEFLPETRPISNVTTETMSSDDLLKDFLKLHQQNYNNLQQQITGMEERLSAVVRLMNSTDRDETQPSIRILENQNEQSILNIRQHERFNEQILGQLSRVVDLLQYTISSQQEQHRRDTEGLHHIIDRTLTTATPTNSSINYDLILKVAQIVIVSLALAVLFKER